MRKKKRRRGGGGRRIPLFIEKIKVHEFKIRYESESMTIPFSI